jgi:hypothetical protein
VFEDVNMLNAFIDDYHGDSTWDATPSVFEDAFEPVYGFGKNAKNLMNENRVLGIKITTAGGSPEEAQQRVQTLGDYLNTCLVNNEVWEYYGGSKARVGTNIIESKASMIQHNIDVSILEKKIDLLNSSLTKYDPVSNYERQVVKLDATTEKYLPVHQQIIASKVALYNIGVSMDKIERQINMDELVLGYLNKVEMFLVDKSKFLPDILLLDNFMATLDSYFESERDDTNALASKYSIEVKLEAFQLLKREQFRFMSGPSLPQRPEKQAKTVMVMVTFFASLVAFITYGVFISWWNRED